MALLPEKLRRLYIRDRSFTRVQRRRRAELNTRAELVLCKAAPTDVCRCGHLAYVHGVTGCLHIENADGVFCACRRYKKSQALSKAGKQKAPVAEAKAGVCCACGYKEAAETPCPYREDGSHCDHWWDGTEEENEGES